MHGFETKSVLLHCLMQVIEFFQLFTNYYFCCLTTKKLSWISNDPQNFANIIKFFSPLQVIPAYALGTFSIKGFFYYFSAQQLYVEINEIEM